MVLQPCLNLIQNFELGLGRALMGKISIRKKKTNVRNAELSDWLLAIDASIA